MHLTHLKVTNFQAIAAFDKPLAPITMICGPNEAGKSSIADAIEFAFTGNPGRAENKKNLSMLVHEGTKEGSVALTVSSEDSGGDLEFHRTVSTGKISGAEPSLPLALPFVLRGSRFARDLDPIKRRSFLYSLMGIKLGPDQIRERLVKRGIDSGLVDQIMHLLAGGFAPAHTEAERKRQDNKAQWHEVTGETWGIKKGEGWIAEAPAFDAAELEMLLKDLDGWQKQVDTLNVKKGEFDAAKKAHDQLPALKEQAKQHATISDRIRTGQKELLDLSAVLEGMPLPAEDKREPAPTPKEPIPAPEELSCPECLSKLMFKRGVLVHYKLPEAAQEAAPAPTPAKRVNKADAARQREEYAAQKGKIAALQSRLQGDHRQLMQAEAAATMAGQLEGTPFDQQAYDRHMAALADAREQVRLTNVERDAMLDVQRQCSQAKAKTVRASELHAEIKRWDNLCAALSPDGVPADVLGEALGPLTKMLKASAKSTGWRLVEVSPAMEVTYAGRPYQLLSESAQWRVDAQLAVAFARISGVGIVSLDRFDVLDLAGRGQALPWLQDSIDFDELQSVMLFATLKSAPSIEGVTAHWIGGAA